MDRSGGTSRSRPMKRRSPSTRATSRRTTRWEWRFRSAIVTTRRRRCFRKALSIDPGQAHVWNNLGYVLLLAGNPREAITPLKTAVKLDRNNTTARRNLREAVTQWELAQQARRGGGPERRASHDEPGRDGAGTPAMQQPVRSGDQASDASKRRRCRLPRRRRSFQWLRRSPCSGARTLARRVSVRAPSLQTEPLRRCAVHHRQAEDGSLQRRRRSPMCALPRAAGGSTAVADKSLTVARSGRANWS